MLKYPSVLLPAVYYSISFGVGSVLFAVTGAAAFGSIYHFNTAQVGMAIGLSTFTGTLIGELAAGPVSDRILYLYAKSHRGMSKPEARLQATWPGFILLPAGIIIEGVCLQYKTHWAGPVMGIGISAFGLQIVSTNVFAYVTDVSVTFTRPSYLFSDDGQSSCSLKWVPYSSLPVKCPRVRSECTVHTPHHCAFSNDQNYAFDYLSRVLTLHTLTSGL